MYILHGQKVAQWKTEFVSMTTTIVNAYNETIAFACF